LQSRGGAGGTALRVFCDGLLRSTFPSLHREERRLRRVSKDDRIGASWFETREDALLTMRV
jgi:hypothetical protein